MYYRSKPYCKEIAVELWCAYYHASVVDQAERPKAWLEKSGFIVAMLALGTGVDFPGIVFVLHMGMPWCIINYTQESKRAGQRGEAVDLVVLLEEDDVERKATRDLGSINTWAMAAFIQARGYWRGTMSKYLDGRRVECADTEGAACNQCGEGLAEWQGRQLWAAWD